MKLYKGTLNFNEKESCVVTLGKFDGVHRGHQELIKRVVAYKGKKLQRTVFSFDVSSVMILSKKERRHLFKKMGVDLVIECPFTVELISMEPEEFVRKILVKRLRTTHIVVGADFRFGYQRAGDVNLLKRLGERYNFTVDVVDKITDGERDISSTYVREELAKGNIEKVNELLGYKYHITGEVVRGKQVGRAIGIPTTNLIPPKGKLLPPNGVYVTETTVGKKTYYGMTNIGCKPTVGGSLVGVETHLFDCEEDLYGKNEKVRLLHFVREERKFESLDALKAQLKEDEETIKRILAQKNKGFS